MNRLLSAFALLAVGCGGATPPPAPPPTALPTLASLAFMEGTWVTRTPRATIEESWSGAKGRTMFGYSRTYTSHGTSNFEHLRIEWRKNGQIVYVAMPGGGSATEFVLASSGGRKATFVNPAHDFPQEISYDLTVRGQLHARISSKTRYQVRSKEWTFSKQ